MTSRYNSHNQTSMILLEACYKAGKADEAEKVRKALHKDLDQQAKYYDWIRANRPELYGSFEQSEVPINERMQVVLTEIEKKYAPQTQTQPKVEGSAPTIINGAGKPDSNAKKDSNK
jgi:hypothetical protein